MPEPDDNPGGLTVPNPPARQSRRPTESPSDPSGRGIGMTAPDDWPISETSTTGGNRRWPGDLVRRLLGRPRLAPILEPSGPVPRFRTVCISREAGAGGGTIARQVATRLDWKVYDHELIEEIARRMEVPIEEAKALDELSPSVIQDWVLPLREEHYAPLEAYLDHLAKLVAAIDQAGESIIVGRGANFLLDRRRTLAVRVLAPPRVRAQRLAERLGVSVRTARRAARDLDRRRRRFVRTMYRADATDPHHYDLVLDSASLGTAIAAEVIARTVEAGLPVEKPWSPRLDDDLPGPSTGLA